MSQNRAAVAAQIESVEGDLLHDGRAIIGVTGDDKV